MFKYSEQQQLEIKRELNVLILLFQNSERKCKLTFKIMFYSDMNIKRYNVEEDKLSVSRIWNILHIAL